MRSLLKPIVKYFILVLIVVFKSEYLLNIHVHVTNEAKASH